MIALYEEIKKQANFGEISSLTVSVSTLYNMKYAFYIREKDLINYFRTFAGFNSPLASYHQSSVSHVF